MSQMCHELTSSLWLTALPCQREANVGPASAVSCPRILATGRTSLIPVCTENLIPVDDVMESPKLAE
jgi:hypothetical protein